MSYTPHTMLPELRLTPEEAEEMAELDRRWDKHVLEPEEACVYQSTYALAGEDRFLQQAETRADEYLRHLVNSLDYWLPTSLLDEPPVGVAPFAVLRAWEER